MSHTFDLDHFLEQWTALPVRRHLVALGLISLIAALRWHGCLLSAEPLIDEATYLEAFRAMAAGQSPYEIVSYHYTPLFAWVGSSLLTGLGESGLLVVLRSASVLGLALAVWCSCAWLPVSWPRRLGIAIGFVALAPAVGAGFCTGNVSFTVIGVILLALVQWPRRSIAAGAIPSGVALGASVAAKPLAPLALVALLCHRPTDSPSADAGPRPERRSLVAGLAGSVTAALLLLPMIPRLDEMAGQPIHRLTYARSFSLDRILSLLGIDVSPLLIVVVGALLVALLVRLRPLDRSRLVAVAVVSSILVTPLIWNHTLILTLPLQVMALTLAFGRWRSDAVRSRWGLYELAFVALGALALQFSEGFGAVDEFPRLAQAAFLSVPYLAPAALLAYVLRAGEERRKR